MTFFVNFKADELTKYKSMIGEDDWCVNFDKTNRMCKIYDERPEFCKVDPAKSKQMFGVDDDDFNVSERTIFHRFPSISINVSLYFIGFLCVLLS